MSIVVWLRRILPWIGIDVQLLSSWCIYPCLIMTVKNFDRNFSRTGAARWLEESWLPSSFSFSKASDTVSGAIAVQLESLSSKQTGTWLEKLSGECAHYGWNVSDKVVIGQNRIQPGVSSLMYRKACRMLVEVWRVRYDYQKACWVLVEFWIVCFVCCKACYILLEVWRVRFVCCKACCILLEVRRVRFVFRKMPVDDRRFCFVCSNTCWRRLFCQPQCLLNACGVSESVLSAAMLVEVWKVRLSIAKRARLRRARFEYCGSSEILFLLPRSIGLLLMFIESFLTTTKRVGCL